MASKILLADESITVQKLVNLAFADEGIEVVAVGSGEAAKRLLDEINVDLALVSSTLPGINGYELCKYIKKSDQLSNLPVVLLLGAFEPFIEAEAQKCGADAHLTKPAESARLVETARKLIEGRSQARADIIPAPTASQDTPPASEAAPKSGSFFKPYVPAQSERRGDIAARPAAERDVQPPLIHREPESPPQPPPDSAILVVWAAACVMLLVIGMAVWQAMHFAERLGSEDSASAQQAEPAPPATGESRPPASALPEAKDGAETKEGAEAKEGEVAKSEPPASAVPEESSSAASEPATPEEQGGAPELISPEPDTDDSIITAPIVPSRQRLRGGLISSKAGARSLVATRSQVLASRALIRERMLIRARQLEDKGLLAQAEQQYIALVASFPNDSISRYKLGRLRASLSSRRNEERSFANRVSGLKAFVAGNYSAAAVDLNAAVKAGRADTAVLYSLGLSNLKLGRVAEAQAALERCLAASPNYAPALVGLAQVKAAMGKNDHAVALLRRALELGGGAEFSPERIKEMISRYSARSTPVPRRP